MHIIWEPNQSARPKDTTLNLSQLHHYLDVSPGLGGVSGARYDAKVVEVKYNTVSNSVTIIRTGEPPISLSIDLSVHVIYRRI